MNGLDLTQALNSLLEFRTERDWSKFHTPRNLSVSIAIEAAELMEHFQWRNDQEVQEYLNSNKLDEVKEEIADIASYLLLLSNDLGIDLNRTILEKVRKNNEKYPVDLCRGKHNKYTEL
ncbi:MAG: nucleotide pyrophosphohydrolase [Clostridiaceae bacterium]|nr:nucleotide pyrophosphohydrolase [Clostridiaceae bacterium]